jgi:hypothetical protein
MEDMKSALLHLLREDEGFRNQVKDLLFPQRLSPTVSLRSSTDNVNIADDVKQKLY